MGSREKRNKIFRIYVNIVVCASIIGGIIFLVAPRHIWPSSYSPTYFGVMAIVSAILIVLPQYVFRSENSCKQEAVLLMQFAIATAFLLNDLGSLYLYQLHQINIQYDKILHLLSPFYLTIILISFMQVWRGLSLKKSVFRSAAVVAVCSIGWELLEYSSDRIFKSTAFGIDGQYVMFDTAFDLAYDFIGIWIAIRAVDSKEFYKVVVSEYCQGHKNVNQQSA